MRRSWERAVRRAGLKESITFHDIRHVWKTNARRSGMDEELREDIMGHWNSGKSINSRYGYISNEELVRAIDGFSSDHGETEVWIARPKKKTRQNHLLGSSGDKMGTNTILSSTRKRVTG